MNVKHEYKFKVEERGRLVISLDTIPSMFLKPIANDELPKGNYTLVLTRGRKGRG